MTRKLLLGDPPGEASARLFPQPAPSFHASYLRFYSPQPSFIPSQAGSFAEQLRRLIAGPGAQAPKGHVTRDAVHGTAFLFSRIVAACRRLPSRWLARGGAGRRPTLQTSLKSALRQ